MFALYAAMTRCEACASAVNRRSLCTLIGCPHTMSMPKKRLSVPF